MPRAPLGRSTRHRSRSRYFAVTSSLADALGRGQRGESQVQASRVTGAISGLIGIPGTGMPLGERTGSTNVEGHMKSAAAAVAGALIAGTAMYTVCLLYTSDA